ncbi:MULTISPECIES: hypothetical protein [unclassified Paenibacillus]|uniref:hypothetical protein n=1 Tax=unclassified Paenibacillus TaxID=185978 RepID=UPI0024BB6159|nr:MULTISPECIES: hypothetical protein [unclassified Paenibacillus]
MTEKLKANVQAIKDIVRMNPVWEQEKGEQEAAELHYYHIVDALNRKWQTIGVDVSDAIQVFERGHNDAWTRIIEPAPWNPNLTTNDLIHLLKISPEAVQIRHAMQIILNTVERRNAFIRRIINVNDQAVRSLLYLMKDEYLRYELLSNETFMAMYAMNPVEALSVYFLESVDVHMYWEWCDAGGTGEQAIQYKREDPHMTLIQAIERVEEEMYART